MFSFKERYYCIHAPYRERETQWTMKMNIKQILCQLRRNGIALWRLLSVNVYIWKMEIFFNVHPWWFTWLFHMKDLFSGRLSCSYCILYYFLWCIEIAVFLGMKNWLVFYALDLLVNIVQSFRFQWKWEGIRDL